jgi:hypothetical protein
METIPFYHTRRFWTVIYSLMLVWSVGFYFFAFYNPNALNFLRITEGILMALGAGFFGLWGKFFLSTFGGYFGVILYVFLQTFLIKNTFTLLRVKLIFPILFLTNFLLGIVMSILFLGSFA